MCYLYHSFDWFKESFDFFHHTIQKTQNNFSFHNFPKFAEKSGKQNPKTQKKKKEHFLTNQIDLNQNPKFHK